MDGMGFLFDLAVVSLVGGVAGLLCRWLHLSVVVGFILAGVLIGPYTPPFQLVEDADRIRMLADLGLVFLVFGIGLGFSVQRLQRLGAGLVLATAITALLVLAGVRTVSSLFGLSNEQGLFVAGVLMVSSSAVIAKVLEEVGANHKRWGQLSLGITLMEDIVAVVMLTLLSSMTSLGEGEGSSGWALMAALTGFTTLVFLAVMLFVPGLLRRLTSRVSAEILVLLTTGMLLSMAWVAAVLGYSVALAAFIFGAIIGGTPHRPEVDRLFEGMRHLFGAVFFVAMGMMFDVGKLPEAWPWLVALTGAAFLLRIPAAGGALLAAGNRLPDALRTAFVLTPLGEFSFVIAYLGVGTGVMPPSFYPAAVGASLLTCILSPLLVRRADQASTRVEALLPRPLLAAAGGYHSWLGRLLKSGGSNVGWKLMAPRIGQTAAQVLVVAGVLAVAMPVLNMAEARLGPDLLFPSGTAALFLIVTGLIVLPPGVAAWRNITALAMIAAEATAGFEGSPAARAFLRRSFSAVAIALSCLWIAVLIPADLLSARLLAVVALLLGLATVLLWRRSIRWHSRFEMRLKRELEAAGADHEGKPSWTLGALQSGHRWDLEVREVVLPANSRHAGKSLIELRLRPDWGCTIASIDRQGFAINNPSGRDAVFPGDRLLLVGSSPALTNAASFLEVGDPKPDWSRHFDELGTEVLTAPPAGAIIGKSLEQLDILGRLGIQVVGIRRSGQEVSSPGGSSTIEAGDELLLLGAHKNIREFLEQLSAGPGAAAADPLPPGASAEGAVQ